MGINPDGVLHIHETAQFLGNSSLEFIEQLAEAVQPPETPFHVVPEFENLRMHNPTPGSPRLG